jgi:choline dehydrogenase-like flavoprotein
VSDHYYDIVIVGSGAGGGTVAQALAPMTKDGVRVLVLEQGPRFADSDFTGRELEMASALYEDGGGALSADGNMTLAYGRAYGGSTVVYTGTSLIAPKKVVEGWSLPGLDFADVERRCRRYMDENGVHLVEERFINENNRLFREGGKKAGFHVEQFPINTRGCKGSSLCNLGCPNAAKQGTNRVQLPNAEKGGVEVVTRACVTRLEERLLHVEVSEKPAGGKGLPSEWQPGRHRVRAGMIVVAGGALGTTALLLRSGYARHLPRLGEDFTCHPAHILVGEHSRPITNDVGHPKSFFIDRAEEGFVLETCMYFPFTTAKNITGFGADHSRFLQAFPRLQMILVLGCDKKTPGNRIGIDKDGKPVVHYRFTPETIDGLVRGTRASARIFFAAGAVRVHAPSANPTTIEAKDAGRIDDLVQSRHFKTAKISVSAAHLMGGCSMGRSTSDSVTDVWGRVHGLPWLRVADSSLFPDSLEINPYLTIMALADRVAEKVRAEAQPLLDTARRAAS